LWVIRLVRHHLVRSSRSCLLPDTGVELALPCGRLALQVLKRPPGSPQPGRLRNPLQQHSRPSGGA
jgi:hypothetical protein